MSENDKDIEHGLRTLQALRYLYREKGMTQVNLAKSMKLTVSEIGPFVQMLQRHGWIEIEKVEIETGKRGSQKRNIILLTKSGRAEAAERELFGTWHRPFAENQLAILEALRYGAEMSTSELAIRLKNSSQNIRGSAKLLLERGWLEMRKEYGKRYSSLGFLYKIKLTPEGKKKADYYCTP